VRFVKLTTNYPLDVAVMQLSDAGEVAFTRSIALVGAAESGGLIPFGMLPSLVRNYTPAKGRKVVAEMVASGLWVTDPAGWRLRTWTKQQDELERLLDRRRKDAERQSRSREKSRDIGRDKSRDGARDASRDSLSRAQGRERREEEKRPEETSGHLSSSSDLPERETDKIDDGPTLDRLIERGAGRLTPAALRTEAAAFRQHNAGRWRDVHDWRRAWSGWLTKAAERNRPTPTPDTPRCPVHPDQPTGSKTCPRCAAEAAPPPDLRAALRASREAS
jgi:hypothetical protein